MTQVFPSQPPSLSLAGLPTLQRVGLLLKRRHTGLYPTRLLALCPPAYAGLVPTTALELPQLPPQGSATTVVAFLPLDFAGSLTLMASPAPDIRVHADISLQAQRAYASWPATGTAGGLASTLWMELRELCDAIVENEVHADVAAVPLVLVAGDRVAVGGFELDARLLRACNDALAACDERPSGYSCDELARAREKAVKYSDMPWTFMRYELRNAGQRLAVNHAPLATVDSAALLRT